MKKILLVVMSIMLVLSFSLVSCKEKTEESGEEKAKEVAGYGEEKAKEVAGYGEEKAKEVAGYGEEKAKEVAGYGEEKAKESGEK